MAYALQEDDEFKSSWRPQQQAQPAGGAGGTAMAPGAAAPAPTGSRFVSFDRYLGANSEAAAKTGEKLGYGVQQKGDQAKQAMDTKLTEFQGATAKGMGGAWGASQNPTKTLLPPSGPAAQVQGNVVTKTAQPLTAQPGYTLDEATALANNTYTGPTSLAAFAPELRGQVEGAQRTAAQLGNEQGRRALLAEGMGRQPGAYSGAMAGLDEALATGSGGNRERFARTSEVYGKLNDWLSQREATAARGADFAKQGVEKQAGRFKQLIEDYNKPPPTPPPPTTAERDAATEQRNVDNRAEALANHEPLQVTSTTDELAASRYGDKVLDKWIAAGRPEFSSWIRTQGGR
jgi:hypothetical protein